MKEEHGNRNIYRKTAPEYKYCVYKLMKLYLDFYGK